MKIDGWFLFSHVRKGRFYSKKRKAWKLGCFWALGSY